MIIYKLENKINGKCYIGQTSQKLSQRIAEHKRSKRKNTAINKAIQKYGISNFIVSILAEEITLEEANYLECKFIKEFNTISPQGYNIALGGKNFLHSQETKDKISMANKGKIRSLETRKLLSDSKKGVTFTESHKLNISKSLKGKKGTFGNLGNIHTEETKNILRIKMVERHKKEGSYTAKLTKEDVIEIKNLLEDFTLNQIAIQFNVTKSTISKIKNNKTWVN